MHRPVDADPGMSAGPPRSDGHLWIPLLPIEDPIVGGGGEVAQRRPGTTSLDRCEKSSLSGEAQMADGIYALMDAMEARSASPDTDRVVVQTAPAQLPKAQDALLLGCQPRDPRIGHL